MSSGIAAQALADAAAVIRMVDESLSEGHLWGPLELSSGNPAGGHGFAHEYRTKRPWIAAGGSYSGALSAWFRQSYPNLVLGALSSSGVVDALLDYPEFDEVIAAAVGPRCGSTLRRLVDYADALMAGTEDEKAFARTAMKAPAGELSVATADPPPTHPCHIEPHLLYIGTHSPESRLRVPED